MRESDEEKVWKRIQNCKKKRKEKKDKGHLNFVISVMECNLNPIICNSLKMLFKFSLRSNNI
jgi:hypothetical protein